MIHANKVFPNFLYLHMDTCMYEYSKRNWT
jgi:hypothetical protein